LAGQASGAIGAYVTAVECVFDARNELGEGAYWSTRHRALYWVDIRKPAVYRYDPAARGVSSWAMPELVSCVVDRERGGLVVGLKSGLFDFDPETGGLGLLTALDRDKPDNRLNDGKCDRRGRFWIGTMSQSDRSPTGSLFRVGLDLRSERMLADIIVPNSIAFAPDDRRMYFADTWKDTIWAHAFDAGGGRLGPPAEFAGPGAAPGRPDGSAVDADGCLWNARYGGGSVVRFTPDGRIDRTLRIPCTNVTCVAFGGSDLRTLYVTTARQRLDAEALEREPLAGGLFAADVGVAGLPEPWFGG
jgi:sugar lactone lactonase YvrE